MFSFKPSILPIVLKRNYIFPSLSLFLMRVLGGQEEKGMTEDEMAGWHH